MSGRSLPFDFDERAERVERAVRTDWLSAAPGSAIARVNCGGGEFLVCRAAKEKHSRALSLGAHSRCAKKREVLWAKRQKTS